MQPCDPIVACIDERFRRCTWPHQHHLIQERWRLYPALHGHTIDDLRATLGGRNDEQNPVIGDLLHAHQHGDDDATTVLLASVIPFVYTDPWVQMKRNISDDRWIAFGRLINTTDPDEPRRCSQRPFLRVLAGRMRRDAKRMPAAEPIDYCSEHLDTHPSVQQVEEQVLARIELDAIKAVLDAELLKPGRWEQLVDHRIHGNPTPDRRSTIGRTGRQLAQYIGHVA